jgi:hypothetical protein
MKASLVMLKERCMVEDNKAFIPLIQFKTVVNHLNELRGRPALILNVSSGRNDNEKRLKASG